MIQIKHNEWTNLVGQKNSGPCVSIYSSIPSREESEAAYELQIESLRRDAGSQLKELGHSRGLREIILGNVRPTFLNIQKPFHGEQRSLGFFSSFGFSAFALIPREVQPLVVVAKSFHIKPLIPMINESSRAMLEQEYTKALSDELVAHSLHEILRLSRFGLVRKLIVANDEMLLGDLESLENSRNFQLNQNRSKFGLDDVLDDLAEHIAANFGEVLTSPRRHLPDSRMAVAFLYSDKRGPEKEAIELSPISISKLKADHERPVAAA